VQCWSTDKRASIDQWLIESSESAPPSNDTCSSTKSDEKLTVSTKSPGTYISSSIHEAAQRIDSIITASENFVLPSNPFVNVSGASLAMPNFSIPPPGYVPPTFFAAVAAAAGLPFGAPRLAPRRDMSSSSDFPLGMTQMLQLSNLITIQPHDMGAPAPSLPAVVLSVSETQAEVVPLPPTPDAQFEHNAPPMPSPSYSPSLSPIPSKTAGCPEVSDHDITELSSTCLTPNKTSGSGIASQTLQNLQDILMNIQPGPLVAKVQISTDKLDVMQLRDFTPPPEMHSSSNNKLDDLDKLFPPPANASKLKLPRPVSADKSVDKRQVQDNVAVLAKKYLKPYFTKNKISKDEYKHIMRKVVFKCTDGKKGADVKAEKVKKMVVNYAIHLQQKSTDKKPPFSVGLPTTSP
jgi:hypothetical protein